MTSWGQHFSLHFQANASYSQIVCCGDLPRGISGSTFSLKYDVSRLLHFEVCCLAKIILLLLMMVALVGNVEFCDISIYSDTNTDKWHVQTCQKILNKGWTLGKNVLLSMFSFLFGVLILSKDSKNAMKNKKLPILLKVITWYPHLWGIFKYWHCNKLWCFQNFVILWSVVDISFTCWKHLQLRLLHWTTDDLPITGMSITNMLAWVGILDKGRTNSTNSATMRSPCHHWQFFKTITIFGMVCTCSPCRLWGKLCLTQTFFHNDEKFKSIVHKP